MSAKLKFKNVKVVRRGKKRVRTSSCCTNRSDNAVEGIQEAGKDLCDLFCSLKNREVAAALVRAIRCRNKKLIEKLIGINCQVVAFFNQGRMSCVRISCVFGECCDVRITFDICVSNRGCDNIF
ncbi:hypothetical protein [Paenibacillus humicola]|uniref:hypothetical protein n=1 Tax=Paenibacillus humicola TaxID=3110540 RepID=UPI00237A1316|nr:hypothetical protein [Paenibacillus humicola]